MREAGLDGRRIVICHVKDGWYALDDICTHAFAKLHEGRLRGTRLICPLHGASFDCRTGAVLAPPAAKALRTHQIRRVGEDIEVALRRESV